MGKARDPEDSQARQLVSVAVGMEDVAPQLFLRMNPGVPRGFWSREGRWFAHLGSVASVDIEEPKVGMRRFRQVWDEALEHLARGWSDPKGGVSSTPPRFFGGFAFSDGHLPQDGWLGFPSARFILPELELTGGDAGGVLTCRGFTEPGEDLDQCSMRLKERLDRAAEAILSSQMEIPPGEAWIPATRVETDLEAWEKTVEKALLEMERGGVSKVVLARVQSVSAEGGLDAVDVVANLWEENPTSHVFLFEPVPGHVLLGAAPETVATLEGGRFRATAVAGSAPRGETDRERASLAEGLLASDKDRREHQICVDDMVRRISPLARKVVADGEPHVLTLHTIQHLETAIEADLKKGQTVLSVLEALHPTPAVCGLPRDLALKFLNREEPFHRGWYAGPVGWFDGQGNGVFVPALRSAVGHDDEWRLFAGAGIVVGSEPRQEWDETRIKFQPVLRALSRAGAGRTPEPAVSEEI